MSTQRDEPIGSIECPKCKRQARVLQFAERTKVDPATDGGRRYPRKLYVDCPHLDEDDERCGVTRMDSKAGQAWILKNAHIGSKASRPSSSSSAPNPSPVAAPDPAASRVTPARTAPDPPPAPAKKKSWMDGLM